MCACPKSIIRTKFEVCTQLTIKTLERREFEKLRTIRASIGGVLAWVAC